MEPAPSYFCIAFNVLDIFVRIQRPCYNPPFFLVFWLVSFYIYGENFYIYVYFRWDDSHREKTRRIKEVGRREDIVAWRLLNRLALAINGSVELRHTRFEFH